jgi:hypothetical protein
VKSNVKNSRRRLSALKLTGEIEIRVCRDPRKTPMAERIRHSSISGEFEAGPIVATILVL